jgi:hypothetical protein
MYYGHELALSNLEFNATIGSQNSDIFEKLKDVTRDDDLKQPSLPGILGEEFKYNLFYQVEDTNL